MFELLGSSLCLEGYWEEFKRAYLFFYAKEQGPWRSVVQKSVERFLECGILRHGFARIHCPGCKHVDAPARIGYVMRCQRRGGGWQTLTT